MSNALSAFADDAEQWAAPVRDAEHDIHFRYERKSPAYSKAMGKLKPAFQALDDMIADKTSRLNEKAKLLEQEYLRQVEEELRNKPPLEDDEPGEPPAPQNSRSAPPPVGGPPELKLHVQPPHARQAMTTKIKMNVRQSPHGALTPPPPTDEVFGTPSSRSDD